jgi:HEAT repeat protein
MKKAVGKSIFFAFLIMAIQVVIYKIYFSDAPPEIPIARLHKDFPAVPESVDEDVRALIERLNSPSENVRLSGANELRKLGDKAKDAVPFLIRVASDESAEVRTLVLDALTVIGDPTARTTFIKALDDDSVDNRKKAARALGKLRDAGSVEPLIRALDDIEWDVRFEAAWALKEITGEDFGADSEKWRKWWDSRNK